MPFTSSLQPIVQNISPEVTQSEDYGALPDSKEKSSFIAGRITLETSLSEHEQIAQLAYFYWQQGGCPDGSQDDDWFRAEQELAKKVDREVTPMMERALSKSA